MEISDDDSIQLPPQPLTIRSAASVDISHPLEDIPVPSGQSQLYADMDLPSEIPLPAPVDTSSARYSPSHVLGAEEDDGNTSPSDRKKSVLGKAQAKKRLMAFSAAKAAAVSSPTSSHTSPLKRMSLMKPQSVKQKPEPVLAIQTIKEEETQMKKMIAMNSILADKLNQVKLIATTIPVLPDISSLTPVPISPDATTTTPQTAVVKPLLAVSEPTVDSSSRARNLKKSKRHSSTHSSSRSLSPASPDRKLGKKRNKSKSRSRSDDRRSKKFRRSKSRSPRNERRKSSKERRREMNSPGRNRDRARRRTRSRDRGRGKRSMTPLLVKPEKNPEFATIRRSRMPFDWTEYKTCEYSVSDVNALWNLLKDKLEHVKGSRRESSSDSPQHVPGMSVFEQPTKFSKALDMPPTGCRLILSSGLVGNYPLHMVRHTNVLPRIQYGYNRLSVKGYYKTRECVYDNENSNIIQEMEVIVNSPIPLSHFDTEKNSRSRTNRSWFVSSVESWCTQEAGSISSKGVVISHLYSDDEESNSPFPVMKDEVVESEKIHLMKNNSSDEVSDVEDGISIDSTPSPLLKQRYREVEEELPSPLLHRGKVTKPGSPSPILPQHGETSEEEVEVKVRSKKSKKERKVKRRNLRDKSSSSDEMEVEKERYRRKREKKRNRRKDDTTDEDEQRKGKKKKSKKRRQDRSPSSDENPPPPPPSGGTGSGGKDFRPGHEPDSKNKDKSKKRESRGGKQKDRHHHKGKHKTFLIDPNEFGEGLDLSLIQNPMENEEEPRENLQAAAQLDPEAQKILSSFETDEFFQFFFLDQMVERTEEKSLEVLEAKEEVNTTELQSLETTTQDPTPPSQLEQKELKVELEESEVKRSRSKVRTIRYHERSRHRSRSRSPDGYYSSYRNSRYHNRYRRRSDSGDRDRYYQRRHSYHRSSSRRHEDSRERSYSRRVTRTPSPPLQLNVADSTISDAELAQQPIKRSPVEIILQEEGEHVQEGDESGSLKRTNGYLSPPRRLSLDERLEVEMGIKLTEEAPKPIVTLPPFYMNGKGGIPIPPPGYQLNPAPGFCFPPPPTYGQQLKVPPAHLQGYWGCQNPPGGMTRAPTMMTRPRNQAQVIQMGDMLRVLPAEMPSAPITITCSTTDGNTPTYVLNGELKQEEKRVVRIKVPVVPFTVPVAQPIGPPPLTEEEKSLRRKRRRAEKLKRLEEKAKAEKICEKENKKEVEEEMSPDELALLKEAISESFDEGGGGEEEEIQEPDFKVDENFVNKVEEVEGYPEFVEDEVGVDGTELGEDQVVMDEQTPIFYDEQDNEVDIPWGSQPVTILPPPENGILVPYGLRERTDGKKAVKFADGIHPGYGSAEEGGEEMCSPPPPPSYPYKKSLTKDKGTKKRKIKIKVLRQGKTVMGEVEKHTGLPPPPILPYPFCPTGILYQVCPQYAVLYAQTMAEKGYDIIFEPSTQQPYGETEAMSTITEENEHPEPNVVSSPIIPDSNGICTPTDEMERGHSPEDDGLVPWPSEKSPSSTHSKIPTILTPTRSEPLYETLELDEIELPRSPLLTESPPPIENPNLLIISPTKTIPTVPTPPPVVQPIQQLIPPVTLDFSPRRIIKKKPSWEQRSVTSISIPLSRIAAARGGMGLISQIPTDSLYQDFEYDFTPAIDPTHVKGKKDLEVLGASKFKVSPRNMNNILIIPAPSTPPPPGTSPI